MTNRCADSLRLAALVTAAIGTCASAFGADFPSADNSASASAAGDPASSTGVLAEIVVTAEHVKESALKVPESISVLDSNSLRELGINNFTDYASKIPNLSFQFGGMGLGFGGSTTIAIRGIANPPTGTLAGATTGLYIDDTPVPNSVDPQVVDIQRIEVLKGPQGTLYGASSLAGNVRIITQEPTFKDDYSYTLSAGYTDHSSTPDGRLSGIGNYSLVDGVAAVRVVAFADHQGGFMTREFPSSPDAAQLREEGNQGATSTFGGSVTALVKFNDRWSVTLRYMTQDAQGHGWPAQYAPLPGFEPSGYMVPRQADVQELWSNRWSLPSLDIRYEGSLWTITSSTSYFTENVYNREDGTEPTEEEIDFLTGFTPTPGESGIPWNNYALTNQFNEEVRASWGRVGPFSGIFGARYADTNTSSIIPPVDVGGLEAAGVWPNDLVWTDRLNSGLDDGALFGQVYYNVSKFKLTLGARKFWLRESSNLVADGLTDGGLTVEPNTVTSQSGISPKAAVSYEPTGDSLIYLSAAKGFRAGGPNGDIASNCEPGELGLTNAQIKNYSSDDLWDYEIGAKGRAGGLVLTGAAFDMEWSNIQQTIVLPVCFLPVTANAGKARVRGGEFEATGHLTDALAVRFGVGYQDAKILDPGLSGLPTDSRILGVPEVTATAAVNYTQPITSSLDGFISSDFSYIGNVVSETPLNVTGITGEVFRAGYGILNARLGVASDRYTFEVYAKNLTNKEANLGELAVVSYEQFDSVGTPLPRVAVTRPFEIGLQFSRGF